MKRNTPRTKSQKGASRPKDHQSNGGGPLPPRSFTAQDFPQLALDLEEIASFIVLCEQRLKMGMELMLLHTGAELEQITQCCIKIENRLITLRSTFCLDMLEAYKLSMAQLGYQVADTNEGYLDTLQSDQPELLPAQHRAPSPEDLEIWLPGALLTAKFLRATGTGPVSPHLPPEWENADPFIKSAAWWRGSTPG